MPPPPDYLRPWIPNAETTVDTYIPQLVERHDRSGRGGAHLRDDAHRDDAVRVLAVASGASAWKGINMNCHDDVAHLDTSDGGSTGRTTPSGSCSMNQFYARCVARLATALDAVPEASGTMLDNTLVVWANEQGRGDHNQDNVPVVLIGRRGGAIPAGGRVIDAGKQVVQSPGLHHPERDGHPRRRLRRRPRLRRLPGAPLTLQRASP